MSSFLILLISIVLLNLPINYQLCGFYFKISFLDSFLFEFFFHFLVYIVVIFIAFFFSLCLDDDTLLSKTLRSLLSSLAFSLFFLINIKQGPKNRGIEIHINSWVHQEKVTLLLSVSASPLAESWYNLSASLL